MPASKKKRGAEPMNPQRLEIPRKILVNDGAKDWSHRKGLAFAGAVAGGLIILLGLMHACYPVPPRAPAAARGHR